MAHRYSLSTLAFALTSAVAGQTFYLTYGSPLSDEYGSAIAACPDGTVLVGGMRNDSALVMKMSVSGSVIWSVTFQPQPGFTNAVGHMIQGPNGSIIGCGTGFTGVVPMNGFYFRLDQAGNLQWAHASNETDQTYSVRILPTAGNDLMLFSDMYQNGFPTWSDPVREQVSFANGDVLWSSPRLNYIAGNPYIDDVTGAVRHNGSYFTTGRIFVDGAPLSTCRPSLSRFDANGAHVQSDYLLFPHPYFARTYSTDLVINEDSLCIAWFGDISGISTDYAVGLIHCDTLANVDWQKQYDLSASTVELTYGVGSMPGGYVLAGSRSVGSDDDLFLLATDRNGNVVWARSFGTTTMDERISNNRLLPLLVDSSGIWLTGVQQTSPTDQDLLLIHADLNGDVACLIPQPLAVTVTDIAPSSTPCTVSETIDPIDYPAVVPGTNGSSLPDACSLHLDLGPDTLVCGFLFLDATTAGAMSYTWQNGSTAPMIPVQVPGTYWVTASVGCCSVTDTIVITFGSAPSAQFISSQVSGEPLIWDFAHGVIVGGCDSLVTWDFGDGTTGSGSLIQHVFPGPGTYSVCITVSCACDTATSCQTITILSTGVAENMTASVSTWLDPASGVLHAWTNGAPMLALELMDASGRALRHVRPGSSIVALTIAELAPGGYVVRFSLSDGTVTTRRIVLR